jgi:hypothetical protein
MYGIDICNRYNLDRRPHDFGNQSFDKPTMFSPEQRSFLDGAIDRWHTFMIADVTVR